MKANNVFLSFSLIAILIFSSTTMKPVTIMIYLTSISSSYQQNFYIFLTQAPISR